MNKVAHYLQQHLHGEILTSSDTLDYFSTDESILTIRPELVAYPRSESDIRKTARFTWQLAEKGRVVPITARGMGTDQTGGSLGTGIILAMPAHMNKIIELDPKTGVMSAEAGISLDKIQQTLYTHGRFLPPSSVVNSTATLGGAVSNNDSSRVSYKYGPMQEYVRGMRVVLANGELIETGRINKRELNKKLGLASFEGEIYRSLDKLIEDSHDIITPLASITNHSSAGYDISDVKQKDGSFDLTPLFVGAQGTLGVITEVMLDTLPYSTNKELLVAGFAEGGNPWKAIADINEFKNGPASIDFVDKSLLNLLQEINPNTLKPLEGGVPDILLFIEVDNDNNRTSKKLIKKLTSVLEKNGAVIEHNKKDNNDWERLRDSASILLTHSNGKKRALPIMDDAQVPIEKMNDFFIELSGLMKAVKIEQYGVWGQAGSGLVHVAPMLDISSVGDRQKIFKTMDAYYSYICTIGGSISGEYAEGRVRGTLNNKLFTPEAMDIFSRIKSIFDPTGTLNPNVKINVKPEQVKASIRDSYSLDSQYNFLPRS